MSHVTTEYPLSHDIDTKQSILMMFYTLFISIGIKTFRIKLTMTSYWWRPKPGCLVYFYNCTIVCRIKYQNDICTFHLTELGMSSTHNGNLRCIAWTKSQQKICAYHNVIIFCIVFFMYCVLNWGVYHGGPKGTALHIIWITWTYFTVY